jgi:hypothetical protein
LFVGAQIFQPGQLFVPVEREMLRPPATSLSLPGI